MTSDESVKWATCNDCGQHSQLGSNGKLVPHFDRPNKRRQCVGSVKNVRQQQLLEQPPADNIAPAVAIPPPRPKPVRVEYPDTPSGKSIRAISGGAIESKRR